MNKIFLLLIMFISANGFALDIPSLTRPIEDKANVLDEGSKSTIESKIRQAYDNKFVQISVLIIPSLEEEVLEDYSIKVAEKWQLGTAKDDNGLLLLIAINDRKMRVEVGNGIEGLITDAYSSRIIENMKPYLRQQDYAGAVNDAVERIIQKFAENTPQAIAEREEIARLEAIEEVKREAKLKEWLGYGANGLLIIFAICQLVVFFDKSEKRELEKHNKVLGDNIAENTKKIQHEQQLLSTLTVDKVKLKRIEVVQTTNSLANEKQKLINKIQEMKRKVG